jgi:hypothetical protein
MLSKERRFEIIKEATAQGYKGNFTDLFIQEEQALQQQQNPQQSQQPEEQIQQPPQQPMPGGIEMPQQTTGDLVQSYQEAPPGIENNPTGADVKGVVSDAGDYKDGGFYRVSDMIQHKDGGYKQKYPHGGPHAPPVPENNAKIYPTEKKSWWDKVLNVAANPVAAFGRSVRGEDVNPGYIERGENAFDTFALGMINPASWIESGQYAVSDFKEGNYVSGALNTLGALPVVPAGIKGIKGVKNLKALNRVKNSKTEKLLYDEYLKGVKTKDIKTRVFKPSSTELDEITKIKDKNVKWLQSDEYVSKRMANTGESKESIMSQIDDYIKELDETPITFKTKADMGENVLGSYKGGDILDGTPSRINILNPAPTNNMSLVNKGVKPKLDSHVAGTIDHEIKHLISPTQKLDKTSSTYKLFTSPKFKAGRKEYRQALDDINDKFTKATSKEEADRILDMYNKVPNREIFDGTYTSKIPNMDKVYKNYPTLKVNSGQKKFTEYLSNAREQQPRLLRGAQWLKSNFNWDGTKSGMSDDMLENIFNQMKNSKNLGGKTPLPDDFRVLLENSSNTTYSKLRNVVSKAWASVPVGLGALSKTDTKQKGGYRSKYGW